MDRYVLEQAFGAQFIIISLRNNMFELEHQVLGINKVKDCTRTAVMNPSCFASNIVGEVDARKVRTLSPYQLDSVGEKRTRDGE